MPIIEPRFKGLYGSLFAVYLLVGTSMTIIGASLPKILADFSWGYGTAGAVIAASSAAFAAASMASGFFLRRIGPKATIVCGAGLIAIGLALFAASPSLVLNLALNALIGAGQGLVEPTINWSVLRMGREGGGTGRSMNLMHGSFAIGAIAGPVVLGALLAAGFSWTLFYRCSAILFALLAIVCASLPFGLLGKDEEKSSSDAKSQRTLARDPVFWLGTAAFLFYVGTELGISTWIAEYFVAIFKSNPAQGSFMVSLFWVGLLVGRIGAPFVYRGRRQEMLLTASSLLLLVSVGALSLLGFAAGNTGAKWLGSPLTFLTGLGCSVIYPTAMSLLGAAFPGVQAQVVAAAVASGGIGLFAFPFIMSWIAQGWGIGTGFQSYVAFAALTTAFCIALARGTARKRNGGSKAGDKP
jgi:fucose permease